MTGKELKEKILHPSVHEKFDVVLVDERGYFKVADDERIPHLKTFEVILQAEEQVTEELWPTPAALRTLNIEVLTPPLD